MSHDKYLRGPASLVNKETEEPEDDLTISYLYGYNKGKEFSLAENKKLRDEVDHLKRCKEFESNLQREVLEVGMPLVPDVISDKTYSVTEAWWAIQKALREMNDGGTSQ